MWKQILINVKEHEKLVNEVQTGCLTFAAFEKPTGYYQRVFIQCLDLQDWGGILTTLVDCGIKIEKVAPGFQDHL